jgi:hypothetical protein
MRMGSLDGIILLGIHFDVEGSGGTWGSVNLRFGGEVVRDADAFSRLAERVDIHALKGG